MNKKLLYIFLTFSSALTTPFTPEAGRPLYPFTDEDLVKYGSHPNFEGILSSDSIGDPWHGIRCSMVPIQTDLPYEVCVTAAHCVLGETSLKKGTSTLAKTSRCFAHPLFLEFSDYDLGVCFFPKNTANTAGYPLYRGDVNALVGKDFIHVGYGTPESKRPSRRAFTTGIELAGRRLESVKPSQASSLKSGKGATLL